MFCLLNLNFSGVTSMVDRVGESSCLLIKGSDTGSTLEELLLLQGRHIRYEDSNDEEEWEIQI